MFDGVWNDLQRGDVSVSIILDGTQMEQLTVVNGVQVSPGEEREKGRGEGERKGGGGGRGLEGVGRNRRQNLLHSVRKVHITFQ